MQKLAIAIISSGILIIIGLALIVVGNQLVLSGITQGGDTVTSSDILSISAELDSLQADTGIFAVQIMEFEKDSFSVTVLDPRNIELVSVTIDSDTIEEEFKVTDSGTYKLQVYSNNKESHVFGAIGLLPSTEQKALGFISLYFLMAGIIGLVGSGVYGIKKKKSI